MRFIGLGAALLYQLGKKYIADNIDSKIEQSIRQAQAITETRINSIILAFLRSLLLYVLILAITIYTLPIFLPPKAALCGILLAYLLTILHGIKNLLNGIYTSYIIIVRYRGNLHRYLRERIQAEIGAEVTRLVEDELSEKNMGWKYQLYHALRPSHRTNQAIANEITLRTSNAICQRWLGVRLALFVLAIATLYMLLRWVMLPAIFEIHPNGTEFHQIFTLPFTLAWEWLNHQT